MKNIRRPLAMLAATVAVALLSGCTPLQLDMYESVTGQKLDNRDDLIALPDTPMKLADGSSIDTNGSIVAAPPYNVKAHVNSLAYSYRKWEPVLEAFRAVASSRGWTSAQIASWETAVKDISLKEAQHCWNVRYNARFAYWDGRNCTLSRSGSGASGYGQITSVLHPITCRLANLCSGPAIVASPYTSMLSLVVLIEDQGVSPWCYNSFARSYHWRACGSPGLNV